MKSKIEDDHTNLTEITVDGNIIYKNTNQNEDDNIQFSLKNEFGSMKISEIIDLVKKEYDESAKEYLKQAVKINQKLSAAGTKDKGCGVGRIYKKAAGDDFIRNTAGKIAAGVDARMSGAQLPALASSGSGNQGIFITLGTYFCGIEFNKNEGEIYKAQLIAHLIAYFIKTKLGKLSSLCGLFTAAAPGLLAALLYFVNKEDKIEAGINNLYSDSGGVICDGAKSSCAFKSISAFELAFRHFQFLNNGIDCPLPTGYINENLKKTLQHQYFLANPDGLSVNEALVKTIKDNFSK